jgi:hypothetical protein
MNYMKIKSLSLLQRHSISVLPFHKLLACSIYNHV